MRTHHEALARTSLLLNQEWFAGEADERAIAGALLASTVRMVGDAESLSCRAGQTALITAFMLTARLGIGIELVAPNVRLIDHSAPLREGRLVDALLELGSDLIPGLRVRTTVGQVDETFAFGSAPGSQQAVRVAASDVGAELERGSKSTPCHGHLPFGGLAAGAAVAAVALEAAVARIEAATGMIARKPRPSPGPPVRIRLSELFPELADGLQLDLGSVDVISGGAITHAMLFCLLRIPGVHARLRIIEEQKAEISNVNRYSLLRASDDGVDKIEQLKSVETDGVTVKGVRSLFTKNNRGTLLPLAERVLVGVDDVRARWWVQEEQPDWLAIGATGNNLARLTTHVAAGPCAACTHPEALAPGVIPTISFVSFWAGFLQACALVSGSRAPTNVFIYPFALSGPQAIASFAPRTNPDCPLDCSASAGQEAA
ncbi:MAG TPA: hypothetical protein VHT27_08995 [Solirubrobacteraceae bacterium]|jgi:hypothetical protein|nr:hypothetical protein [Solirubrobacteraceae bacterium]